VRSSINSGSAPIRRVGTGVPGHLTVLTLATAIPTVILAKQKGRSVAGWLFLALSIPVVPLLLVWLLPKLPQDPAA
jgi:hypothetical protein